MRAGNSEPVLMTVVLDENNFPDARFREYVAANVDVNHNGYLSPIEIESVVDVNLSGMGISSLSGIEYFVNLETLDCSQNLISELNLTSPSTVFSSST